MSDERDRFGDALEQQEAAGAYIGELVLSLPYSERDVWRRLESMVGRIRSAGGPEVELIDMVDWAVAELQAEHAFLATNLSCAPSRYAVADSGDLEIGRVSREDHLMRALGHFWNKESTWSDVFRELYLAGPPPEFAAIADDGATSLAEDLRALGMNAELNAVHRLTHACTCQHCGMQLAAHEVSKSGPIVSDPSLGCCHYRGTTFEHSRFCRRSCRCPACD